MSTPVSPRPLSLVPFFAADAALLLTAVLVAWRTPGEITGGALLAVTACTVLGALLAVLPFVLNDARERDAALAERQRELAELVNTSTANASRWGTQWASAATGLEDAAGLASRSLAAAERLPEVFRQKTDALAEQLDRAGREAQTRAEQLEAAEARFQATLAECVRAEAGLRGQREAIADVLAEFPDAAEQAKAAQVALDLRLAEISAQAEAHAARVAAAADEAGARLSAATEALGKRLAEAEGLIGGLAAGLARIATLPEPAPAPVAVAAPVVIVPEPVPAKTPEVVPMPKSAPAEKPQAAAGGEAIMDPFLIPDDGYASLAEAMDARNA